MKDQETNLHPKNNPSIDLRPNIVTGNIPDKAVTFKQLDKNLQIDISSHSFQIAKNTADISSLGEKIDDEASARESEDKRLKDEMSEYADHIKSDLENQISSNKSDISSLESRTKNLEDTKVIVNTGEFDPTSDNPASQKSIAGEVDERLQGLVSTATFTPVKEKANNSLQKPAGLTKTELVGVGANGQENIEIGDNLTLENGKLSASGDNDITEFVLNDYLSTSDFQTLAQAIYAKKDTILLFGLNPSISNVNTTFVKMIVNVGKIQNFLFVRGDFGEYSGQGYVCIFSFNSNDFETIELHLMGANGYLNEIKLQVNTNSITYSHFINLTNNTSTFYFTYQNTSGDKLNTLDSLKTALTGKRLLCTGHTNSETAEYIFGEGANIVVGVVDKSDNSTSGITIDSSFTITDLVSPVE